MWHVDHRAAVHASQFCVPVSAARGRGHVAGSTAAVRQPITREARKACIACRVPAARPHRRQAQAGEPWGVVRVIERDERSGRST